jgi:hypothetical protein
MRDGTIAMPLLIQEGNRSRHTTMPRKGLEPVMVTRTCVRLSVHCLFDAPLCCRSTRCKTQESLK